MEPSLTTARQRDRNATLATLLRSWLLLLSLWLPNAFAEELQLELLLSSDSAPYRQLAKTFEKELTALCHGACTLRPLRVSQLADWQAEQPRDLLITIGNSAAYHAAVRYQGPTVHGLIPSQTWRKLLDAHGSTALSDSSAVFLDQPVARQLRLLKLSMQEDRRRVGVILGPDSKELLPELEAEARSLGLSLSSITVEKWQQVGPTVQALSKQIDVLLAEPDEVVFNRNTLYGILLTSYETRVPVMGYSEALARAGAMLSLYTSLADMARQLAEHCHYFLEHDKRLPRAGPSRHFNITINHQVARSLGYELDNSKSLHFQIDTSGGLHAPKAAAK